MVDRASTINPWIALFSGSDLFCSILHALGYRKFYEVESYWLIGNHARRCSHSVVIADWSIDSELREVTSLTRFSRSVQFH